MTKPSESIEDIIVLATCLDEKGLSSAGADQADIDSLSERAREIFAELLEKHGGNMASWEDKFITCFWSSEKETEKAVKFIEEFRKMFKKEAVSVLQEGTRTDILYQGMASGTCIVSRAYKKKLFKKIHTGTELYGDLVNRAQYYASHGRNHNVPIIIGEEQANALPTEAVVSLGEIDYKDGTKKYRVFSLRDAK